jgi:predicted kinase
VEAVVFVGIQASGKSSFYRARFFDTHLRINLDMLKTRHREQLLLHACIEAKQPFVVDNTNPTVEERARYIELASSGGFRVVGSSPATPPPMACSSIQWLSPAPFGRSSTASGGEVRRVSLYTPRK